MRVADLPDRMQAQARALLAAVPNDAKHLATPVAHIVAGDDGMNKTERAYAQYLELRRQVGDIQRYDREPEKLRLADNTFYTPDFRVIANDGAIEMHEVKGFWRDDARVKIKVAASLHPYRFIAVFRRQGVWEYETIRATR